MSALKFCPFCGDVADFYPDGTCYGIHCSACGVGYDIQISDILSSEQKKSAIFNFNIYEDGYDPETILIAKRYLLNLWNTRSGEIYVQKVH